MPPVPNAEPAPSASASTSGVMRSTTGMSFASGWVWGLAVYRPSMSLNSTSRSAWMQQVTMAASVSLSPIEVISSVATVSFSLMMGSAPSSSSRVRVFWKFSRRPSYSTSTPVSRICATLWL